MKTIKIKYVGFWKSFEPDKVEFIKTIFENYNVVESDNPDYIICSAFEEGANNDFYEYCKYPQVRIMYSGENYIPDFNFIDYAVSPYPIIFQDRHFRYPVCFDNYNNRFNSLLNKNRNYQPSILNSKTLFANFIASHESEDSIRGDFYKRLCKYKRVESCGSFLNNQPNGEAVTIFNKDELQKKCKFTLCFESTKHDGFVTEKIADAFYADTIPVYYGSKEVKKFFNPESFIYCESRDDFNRVINQIIELDNNDEKYLEMLRKPIFNDVEYAKNIKNELTKFVKHIFDQPLPDAYRRSRIYAPASHERYLLRLKKINEALSIGKPLSGFTAKQVGISLLKTVKRNTRANRAKRKEK